MEFRFSQILALVLCTAALGLLPAAASAQGSSYEECMNEVGDPSYCIALFPPPQVVSNITLLQPLSGEASIATGGSQNPLFAYFTSSLYWIQAVALGVCVLWVVIGGMMIMVSGNNSGLRDAGKQHAIWAIMGLVLLFFLGFTLELLNAYFFRQ